MPFVGYYNGEFVEDSITPVAIEERGHQFGDGIYEVVRVYGGRPFLLDWHLDRMDASLLAVEIKNPLNRAGWTELIHEAIRRSGEPESIVYWQVTRGTAPRNHVFPSVDSVVSLTVRPLSSSAGSKRAQLPPLVALPDERWANAYVKSINLLPNVIAKEIAHRFDAQESMLVRDGRITECSGSNVFFVKDGALYTAPTNRFILPGITRKFVLQLAAEAGVPVHEQYVELSELQAMEEVFVTSTTQEIQPIGEILVPVEREASLSDLSEARPSSLVNVGDAVKSMWRAQSAPVISLKLAELYSEYVRRIREGETQLALGQ